MRVTACLALTVLLAACSGRAGGDPLASPEASGAMDATAPTLVGTHWRLVGLGTTPLATGATQREAFITLTADRANRVGGSNGCNTIYGTYTLAGAALSFGPIGSTKMACVKGMEIESAFNDALAKTAGWRITGQQLELTDATGAVVAEFTK